MFSFAHPLIELQLNKFMLGNCLLWAAGGRARNRAYVRTSVFLEFRSTSVTNYSEKVLAYLTTVPKYLTTYVKVPRCYYYYTTYLPVLY